MHMLHCTCTLCRGFSFSCYRSANEGTYLKSVVPAVFYLAFHCGGFLEIYNLHCTLLRDKDAILLRSVNNEGHFTCGTLYLLGCISTSCGNIFLKTHISHSLRNFYTRREFRCDRSINKITCSVICSSAVSSLPLEVFSCVIVLISSFKNFLFLLFS